MAAWELAADDEKPPNISPCGRSRGRSIQHHTS